MVDESLRKPRRKPKASLHLLESPFPIPIQTITGKKCDDKRWYYYFGTLHSDHVSISRLGDLTFLYRLGFFGKGVFSRSQPQFEKYKDVLSDHGRKGYMQHFSIWEPKDRVPQQHVYANITRERLRQHAAWVKDEDEKLKSPTHTDNKIKDIETKYNEMKADTLDDPLVQCTDLHTEIDNLLVEECSSDSEDIDLYIIPTVEEVKKCDAVENIGVVNKANDMNTIKDVNKTVKTDKTDLGNEESDRALTSTKDNNLYLNNKEIHETCEIDIHTHHKQNKDICNDKEITIEGTDNTTDTNIADTNIADTNIANTNTADTSIADTNIADNTSEENPLKRPLPLVVETISEKKIKLGDTYKLYECLQLTLEEAFFLSYGLGCLAVTDGNNHMTLQQMWDKFSTKQNNFIPIYAAYHHFRSKGWVVRFSKIYGSDFVLYQDGVAFHHASYCVNVHFVHEDKFSQKDKQFSWKQLSAMCRINERAGKEVLFCYVIQPKDMTEEDLTSPSCIKQLKIMEVVMRRWSAEKSR